MKYWIMSIEVGAERSRAKVVEERAGQVAEFDTFEAASKKAEWMQQQATIVGLKLMRFWPVKALRWSKPTW